MNPPEDNKAGKAVDQGAADGTISATALSLLSVTKSRTLSLSQREALAHLVSKRTVRTAWASSSSSLRRATIEPSFRKMGLQAVQ